MNIQNFCDYAGPKINMTKTQFILLGNLKDGYEEISGIKRTTQQLVKEFILVITNHNATNYTAWIKLTKIWKDFLTHGKRDN